jgi:hypothetical protein
MPLEQELATFEAMKPDLLRNHAGKFVLIKGDRLIDTFDTSENAYSEGVQRFGQEPFLVKPVREIEEIYRNHALYSGLMNAHF